jgi:hypothetical protein
MGSLGISVIQNLLYTDFTEKMDLHGFFQAFSVQIQEIVAVGRAVTHPPPAQIPACGITALGFSEILASA